MTDQRWQLRYTEAAYSNERFGHLALIRYPARKGVNRQTVELMRAAMPHPEQFEIVEEND